MSDNYYLGTTTNGVMGANPRFFYAMRRNSDGELFFVRIDQISDKDSIELNAPGDPSENYNDFEQGFDFFEGIDSNHEPVYDNLYWPQYKWSDISVLYYVDDDGQLVQRTHQNFDYPAGISS